MSDRYEHSEGPGSTPEHDIEIRAFGFGATVEHDSDLVFLRQAVNMGGYTVIVRSELDPETARFFAASMVEAAKVAETPQDERVSQV